MINLRASTQEDVRALYGSLLPLSVMGITGEDGDRLLGMGAIYPRDGCTVIICRISPEAREELGKYTRSLLIAAKTLLKMASHYKMPVRAVADRKIPRAVALLEHLGFRHIEKDVYEWTTQA